VVEYFLLKIRRQSRILAIGVDPIHHLHPVSAFLSVIIRSPSSSLNISVMGVPSSGLLSVNCPPESRLGIPNEISAEVAQWLTRHQPCLFGRMAAKAGLMTYCILSEADLTGTDQAIRDKIQDARL
jgi:hypothetical protein